jgi:hypothetical protein
MKCATVILIPCLLLAVVLSAPAAPAAPPTDACRTESTKALVETAKLLTQSKTKGTLSKDEGNAFKTVETNLKNYEKRLSVTGLPLTECQTITKELATIKVAIVNMAAARALPPKPSPDEALIKACRAENAKAHAVVMQIFNKAVQNSTITPAEKREFASSERTLKKHEAALAKSGLSLEECQSIGKDIAKEKTTVLKMAAGK